MALSLHPGWQLDFLLSPQAAAAQHDGAVNLCISWCLSGGLGEEGFRGKGMEHVPALEAPVCIDGTEHFLLACRSLNAAQGWQPGAPAPTHCDRRRQPAPLFALDEHVINGNGRKWGPHQYSNSLYSLCHSPCWLSLLQISFLVPLLDFCKAKQNKTKKDRFTPIEGKSSPCCFWFLPILCLCPSLRLDLVQSKEMWVLWYDKVELASACCLQPRKCMWQLLCLFPGPPESGISGKRLAFWPPLSEKDTRAREHGILRIWLLPKWLTWETIHPSLGVQ